MRTNRVVAKIETKFFLQKVIALWFLLCVSYLLLHTSKPRISCPFHSIWLLLVFSIRSSLIRPFVPQRENIYKCVERSYRNQGRSLNWKTWVVLKRVIFHDVPDTTNPGKNIHFLVSTCPNVAVFGQPMSIITKAAEHKSPFADAPEKWLRPKW